MIETFEEYQNGARATAIYPGRLDPGNPIGLAYAALGLGNEAGEVQGKVKKMLRDDDGWLTPERRQEIIKELGDVLWYAAAVADEVGVSLSYVAALNLKKLNDRAQRGVIGGDGDNR